MECSSGPDCNTTSHCKLKVCKVAQVSGLEICFRAAFFIKPLENYMGIVGIVVKPLRVYMGVGFGFGVRVFMNSGRAVRASVYSFRYEIWDLTVAQTKQIESAAWDCAYPYLF